MYVVYVVEKWNIWDWNVRLCILCLAIYIFPDVIVVAAVVSLLTGLTQDMAINSDLQWKVKYRHRCEENALIFRVCFHFACFAWLCSTLAIWGFRIGISSNQFWIRFIAWLLANLSVEAAFSKGFMFLFSTITRSFIHLLDRMLVCKLAHSLCPKKSTASKFREKRKKKRFEHQNEWAISF